MPHFHTVLLILRNNDKLYLSFSEETYFQVRIIGARVSLFKILLLINVTCAFNNYKHISHQAHCSERAPYISLKLTASVERADGGVAQTA